MDSTEFKNLAWPDKAAHIRTKFRPIPIGLISMYGYVCYRTWEWYIALPDPTATQTTFASMIWGAAAVWFGVYVNSGDKK